MSTNLWSERLQDWPRDTMQNHRYLCTKDKPMPQNAPGQWAHSGVQSEHSGSDYSETYSCKDCGKIWEEELPQ